MPSLRLRAHRPRMIVRPHRTRMGMTLMRGPNRRWPAVHMPKLRRRLQPLCLLLLPARPTSNHKAAPDAKTATPAKGHPRELRAQPMQPQPPTRALHGGLSPVTTSACPHERPTGNRDHLGRATCATHDPRTSPTASSIRRNPNAGPVPRASAGARSANGTYHWLTSPRTNVA